MSGRKLADAIDRHSRRRANAVINTRRGHVIATAPLALKLFGTDTTLVEDDDFWLSQWAKLYNDRVRIAVDDVVVLQREHGDWVLTDIVSDRPSADMRERIAPDPPATVTLRAGPPPPTPARNCAELYLNADGDLCVIFDSGNSAVVQAHS